MHHEKKRLTVFAISADSIELKTKISFLDVLGMILLREWQTM
jgi:hypothetical protein